MGRGMKTIDTVETSQHTFSHFGAFAALAKALICGKRVWAKPSRPRALLGSDRPPWHSLNPSTNPPQTLARRPLGRRPARASQHSLRLLLETGLGKTLTAVGPTRTGLVLVVGWCPAPAGPSAGSGFAALAKAFARNKFRPNPRGCGLNSGRTTPLAVC